MKPITDELINQYLVECYEGTALEKTPDAWLVTTPAGRKVKIHDYHIDFRGITVLAPGETKHDREQWQFELMSLAVEAWGVVSLVSLKDEKDGGEAGLLWLYAKCYKLPVENRHMRVGSTQAKLRFGEEATVESRWGCWRISVGEGVFAEIALNPEKELMVTKAIGGPDVLEAAVLLVEDLQGYVIAGGTKENILACMGHGAALGTEVTPELYFTSRQNMWLCMAMGFPMWIVIFAIAISTNDLQGGLPGWRSIIAGFVLANILMQIFISKFRNNGRKAARERGQALKGNYPSLGRRQSNIDDARLRGML